MRRSHRRANLPPPVRWKAIVISSTLIAIAFIFFGIFYYQQYNLHHAVTLHSKAMRLEMKEGDWQTVWNIADVSRDKNEFLGLLRAEGMLVVPEDDDKPQKGWKDHDDSYDAIIVEADRIKEAGKEHHTTAGSHEGDDYGNYRENEDGPHDVLETSDGEDGQALNKIDQQRADGEAAEESGHGRADVKASGESGNGGATVAAAGESVHGGADVKAAGESGLVEADVKASGESGLVEVDAKAHGEIGQGKAAAKAAGESGLVEADVKALGEIGQGKAGVKAAGEGEHGMADVKAAGESGLVEADVTALGESGQGAANVNAHDESGHVVADVKAAGESGHGKAETTASKESVQGAANVKAHEESGHVEADVKAAGKRGPDGTESTASEKSGQGEDVLKVARDVLAGADLTAQGESGYGGADVTAKGKSGYGNEKRVLTDSHPPPMSAALATELSVNNTVIVTWANYALWDFVKSWVKHVQDLGITNFIVGAMDAQIGKALIERDIPSFAMYQTNESDSGVGDEHLAWGGESFHKMGRQKISLAKLFLDYKLNLLLVDGDVVILRNVLEYFDRFPEADILVSTDQLSSTTIPGDEGLEFPAFAGAPMNIGIMFFRYNNNTLRFVDTWLDAINAKPDYWDQEAFNDLARLSWDPINKVHPKNNRIFIGFNDSLAVGVLPTAMFSGGHTYYIQKLHEVQEVEPYAVHCTFQYGGNVGKRNRMREAMIFYDEEEYYTGDNYIMIDVKKSPRKSSIEHNLTSYKEMKEYNVQGLQMQLESIYPAIGLSLLFNRSFIVPKLACYCDRSWMPLDRCKINGAFTQRLPFVCPMDYVLDPVFMTDDASALPVKWREHSFLENPRCPQSVKTSKLTIFASEEYKIPQEKYSVQDGGTVLLLPAMLSSDSLLIAMKPYKRFKVWHFKDAGATLGTIKDDDLELAYNQRILHLVPVTQPNATADGIPM